MEDVVEDSSEGSWEVHQAYSQEGMVEGGHEEGHEGGLPMNCWAFASKGYSNQTAKHSQEAGTKEFNIDNK